MSLPTDNIPERLYFPAAPDEVEALLQGGLQPVDRTMVHLSKTWNDAYEAGIHREGPDPVIIRIDAEEAQNNGIIIQRAGKTVYTVEEIPSDFLLMSDEEDIELSRQEMLERGVDPDIGEGAEGEGVEDSEDDDIDIPDDESDEDLMVEDGETDDDLDLEDDLTDDDLDVEEDLSDS